jgi:hypothetical protein
MTFSIWLPSASVTTIPTKPSILGMRRYYHTGQTVLQKIPSIDWIKLFHQSITSTNQMRRCLGFRKLGRPKKHRKGTLPFSYFSSSEKYDRLPHQMGQNYYNNYSRKRGEKVC